MGVRRIFIGLLFCLGTICMNAQSIEVLSQQSFDEIRDSIRKYVSIDTAKTIVAAKAYIVKAKSESNLKNEWLGIEAIGLAYVQNGHYSLAQGQFELMRDFAEENKLSSFLIRSYSFAAGLEMRVPNTTKMMEHLERGLQLAEETDNVAWKETLKMQISSMLEFTGDVSTAIAMRKKTLLMYSNKTVDSTFTDSIKRRTLGALNLNLANSYLQAEKADSAEYYLSEVKKYVSSDDDCKLKILLMTQGEIDFLKKNYAKARFGLNKANTICDSDSKSVDLYIAYLRGKVEHGDKNFKAARDIFIEGLESYQISESEEGYTDKYYKLLAESLKETGDFEKANFYFEKYINSTSEYKKIEEGVTSSIQKKELNDFQEEVVALKAEKRNQKLYLLITSLLILGLLLLLLRFYRIKKKNELKFEALLQKLKTASANESRPIIDTKDEVLEEKSANEVSDDITEQIIIGLKKLEQQEYFLNQDCNSYNVAKKIKTNTSYLSKVVNTHYQKNFNTYINDLRINYAVKRLKEDVFFRSYSIQSIAEEVGYKSADSFTKYFKKHTGLNPSFYIKEIKNVA